MYRILNINHPILWLILPTILAYFWFSDNTIPQVLGTSGPIHTLLIQSTIGTYAFIPKMLGGLMLFFLCFLIEFVIYQYRIVDSRSVYVAVLFLLTSNIGGTPLWHPAIIGGAILSVALVFSFGLTHGNSPVKLSFFAGGLVGLAGLFYYPFWLFLPIVFIPFFTIIEPNLRTIVSLLIGWFLPIVYYISYVFIIENQTFDKFLWQAARAFQTNIEPINTGQASMFFYIMFLLVLVFGIFEFILNYYKLTIVRRKSYRIVIITIGFGTILLVVLSAVSFEIIAGLAMFIAFLISRISERIQFSFWREIFIIGFILNFIAQKIGF